MDARAAAPTASSGSPARAGGWRTPPLPSPPPSPRCAGGRAPQSPHPPRTPATLHTPHLPRTPRYSAAGAAPGLRCCGRSAAGCTPPTLPHAPLLRDAVRLGRVAADWRGGARGGVGWSSARPRPRGPSPPPPPPASPGGQAGGETGPDTSRSSPQWCRANFLRLERLPAD